jgi:hypothetical protein
MSAPATADAGAERIDWVHSAGLLAGLALAVGLEIVEGPVALALAAAPLLRVVARSSVAPEPVRAVGRLLQGLSVPLGGGDGVLNAVRLLARRAG